MPFEFGRVLARLTNKDLSNKFEIIGRARVTTKPASSGLSSELVTVKLLIPNHQRTLFTGPFIKFHSLLCATIRGNPRLS